MSKFTHGPWYLESTGNDGLNVVSDAHYICTVDTDLKANEANAQLIACAPELLLVVKRLCNVLVLNQLTVEYADTLDLANALIAKAEGKE